MRRRLLVDPRGCTAAHLEEAARWLRAGGVVAFPTDTFYGLAADPASDAAVQSLFAIKGRDATQAIPLLASSIEAVEQACGALDSTSSRLARAFWPGPLSLVLGAPSSCAPSVHGRVGTVAVRVPSHPVARALAEAFGGLITATSANRTGARPAREPADVDALAEDDRLFVVDGGATAGGMPSTIVDARRGAPVLLREGAIAWSRVLEFLDR